MTDTKVAEFAYRVVIGVRVDNTYPRSQPWEEGLTNMVGYAHRVRLKLKQPLPERTVVDKASHRHVEINRPEPVKLGEERSL